MSAVFSPLAVAWNHHRAGNLAEAERMYRELLRANPHHADAWNLLGALQVATGRIGDAANSFTQTIRLRPEDASAHNNLGVALSDMRQYEEALAVYRRAIELQHDYPDPFNNMGSVLRDLRRYEEAESAYRKALSLRPDYAEAHNNLGLLLSEMGRHDEAIPVLRQALKLRPDYPAAHLNLANALRDANHLNEALRVYDAVLQQKPAYAEARYNRSHALLLLGRHAEGWEQFEWRWKCREYPRYVGSNRPAWDGAALEGRTILLHAEQGLGDTIQFVRYAPLVKACGGTVLLHCPDPLVDLLAATPGIDGVIPLSAAAPPHDVRAPLMSLPHLLRATVATIPATFPYLAVEAARVQRWKERLPGGALNVGVVWQGNAAHRADRQRSFPLAALEPLARLGGVRLISLQKGPAAEQVAGLAGGFPLVDLGPELESLVDTAAVMKSLDLVIAPSTAALHLAGALGVRAWGALMQSLEWRWPPEQDGRPLWYPRMRLFRQRRAGDWAGVIAQMAEALGGELADARAFSTATTPAAVFAAATAAAEVGEDEARRPTVEVTIFAAGKGRAGIGAPAEAVESEEAEAVAVAAPVVAAAAAAPVSQAAGRRGGKKGKRKRGRK